jgi:tripartite-type tricarboxylate transporter receptor subunit TctC
MLRRGLLSPNLSPQWEAIDMQLKLACLISGAALALMGVNFPAAGQDYPTRTIRVIANQSPGGISDIFIRAVGEELHKRWKQPVVVENRPGGMENIGVRACQDSPPDGYTICILYSDPLVFNPHLFKALPFNIDGVEPVTNLFYLLQTMVVNSSLGVKTLDELVELSKAKPGTLSFATASHSVAVMMNKLKEERGADWVRVPFKGGGDAVNAVLSGATPIAIIGEGNVVSLVRAGKMTPIVMVNNIRSSNFPDVPTLEESGYKGPPSRAWFGLFVPKGTPKDIIEKLATEVASIVNDPAFKERHLTARSLVSATNSPAEFAAEIERDRQQAAQVVRDAGLKPQ